VLAKMMQWFLSGRRRTYLSSLDMKSVESIIRISPMGEGLPADVGKPTDGGLTPPIWRRPSILRPGHGKSGEIIADPEQQKNFSKSGPFPGP